MSATLYVEGPDRDALIAAIRAEHGYAAKITAVTRGRTGGVLGFFAQEYTSIAYVLPEAGELSGPEPSRLLPAEQEPERVGRHTAAGTAAVTLEDLMSRADVADGPSRPRHQARESQQPDTQPDDEFARLLSSFAAPAAAQRDPEPFPSWLTEPDLLGQPEISPAIPSPVIPLVQARASVPVTETGAGAAARQRLAMLADLRSVGVPVAVAPETGETSLYRAIEQVVEGLAPAPVPPSQAGDILVLTGGRAQLAEAAELLAQLAHVPPHALWRAGAGVTGAQTLNGPLDAARRALALRTGATPAIVLVELDDSIQLAERYSWAAQVIAALAPTAVWAAVDAGRKNEDQSRELARLGSIDALIVSGAARTSTPATVWDLDIPVAMLDGRPATAGIWAGLLFDALRASGER